jgi:membrane-associated phospholipid phosphatase
MFIVLYYSIKAKMKGWNILFAIITAGIWFGAVYSGHHYIIDVLAGILCTIIGITIFQWWLKTSSGKATLRKLILVTSK